jgi:hypothetical protein
VTNTPADLFAALAGAPSLPGARCRGRAHLFDEASANESAQLVAQRHAQALGLCRGCTALASCTRWFDTLTPKERPHGVVAGRVHSVKRRTYDDLATS